MEEGHVCNPTSYCKALYTEAVWGSEQKSPGPCRVISTHTAPGWQSRDLEQMGGKFGERLSSVGGLAVTAPQCVQKQSKGLIPVLC